jgi:uncharacterized membrane protein
MAADDELRQQLAELSARVASLEAAVQLVRVAPGGVESGAPVLDASVMGASVMGAPVMGVPVMRVPVGAETTVSAGLAQGRPAAALKPDSSLENRIGAQLLNRIGILAVLIGMAWFLKLAFDRNWIGPPVRVLVGLVCAGGLVGWSERFRRQGFPAFSYSLKALGTGIAYLSLWAASSIFHLAPTWIIFFAMTAVTIANAVLARRQDSELLALYALAGGLATPGLLATGLDNEVFLFSYLALLNAGALLAVALHGWNRVAWAALLGTGFYYMGWTLSAYSPTRFPTTAFFLCLFFALFAAAPFLMLRRAPSPLLGNSLFPVAFPIANAAATWIALLLLFGVADGAPGRFWITLLLSLTCLLLAAAARRAVALSHTHLGLGIFFVTMAIPLEFHGYVVTLLWLGESLLLVVLAKAWAHAAMRVLAAIVLAVAAASLLLDWIVGTPRPLAVVANMHFATALVGAAVFAAVTVLSLRELPGPGAARSFPRWTWLAGFASVAFSLTLLVAVSLEIHHYWFCGAGFFRDFCRGYGQLERRSITAGFGLSAWWMLYGAALMAIGFVRRSAFLRWQALVLLALSVGKVFLNGVSLESQGYRVLSFLALGVLLLAVSFAYQKDWLRLRG